MEYLQQAVAFDDKDGHTWEELAYCYLMINDLQNSYTAYQHALYHIQNPKVCGGAQTSRQRHPYHAFHTNPHDSCIST